MKVYVCIIHFFLVFTSYNFASTLVISDIDDTIRQTNVLNLARAATTVVYKAPEFNAIKDIFNQLKFYYAKGDVDFYYLSASPKCLLDYNKWILEKNFPVGNVIQRPCNVTWLWPNYSAQYKFITIENIIKSKLAAGSLTRVLLFGDNAEHDAYVYQKIKNDFPHLAIEIFIRDIRVEATPVDDSLIVKKLEGVNYFLTEFDLIRHAKFYFVTEQQKANIKEAFKTAKLFPKYLYENLASRYEKELRIDDDLAIELAYETLIKKIHSEKSY